MSATNTTPRARLPRTLAGLSSHPWVESIDDARGSGDGIHVYLRPGFVWAGTTSAVIEPTVKACCEAFRAVVWDPEAWSQVSGASAAEVAALTGEATPAPAEAAPAPSIAGAVLEASSALNAEGEAATSRALATLGRIRAGLEAIAEADAAILADEAAPAPRPTLPGEATPPPAPSHGEAAPTLPELRADAAAGRPVSLAALARAARRAG